MSQRIAPVQIAQRSDVKISSIFISKRLFHSNAWDSTLTPSYRQTPNANQPTKSSSQSAIDCKRHLHVRAQNGICQRRSSFFYFDSIPRLSIGEKSCRNAGNPATTKCAIDSHCCPGLSAAEKNEWFKGNLRKGLVEHDNLRLYRNYFWRPFQMWSPFCQPIRRSRAKNPVAISVWNFRIWCPPFFSHCCNRTNGTTLLLLLLGDHDEYSEQQKKKKIRLGGNLTQKSVIQASCNRGQE